eukprot:TRINITY_DN774519_c0_g1_i1.p1 TRINITY_DN774519_c0_g1~~TRINITY_DN774519_c0_g1_i1.p1  ORF type:complete len:243 (+),score=65.24 TRINITY_DN774519_c0_g1_i1:98-826(+)
MDNLLKDPELDAIFDDNRSIKPNVGFLKRVVSSNQRTNSAIEETGPQTQQNTVKKTQSKTPNTQQQSRKEAIATIKKIAHEHDINIILLDEGITTDNIVLQVAKSIEKRRNNKSKKNANKKRKATTVPVVIEEVAEAPLKRQAINTKNQSKNEQKQKNQNVPKKISKAVISSVIAKDLGESNQQKPIPTKKNGKNKAMTTKITKAPDGIIKLRCLNKIDDEKDSPKSEIQKRRQNVFAQLGL